MSTAAIERKVEVKLLVSDWAHTRPSIRNYVRSLTSLNKADGKVSVEGKMFKVKEHLFGLFKQFKFVNFFFFNESTKTLAKNIVVPPLIMVVSWPR